MEPSHGRCNKNIIILLISHAIRIHEQNGIHVSIDIIANSVIVGVKLDKYVSLQQPIHLIGVEFSKKARNVVGFEIEAA
ncbi:MAG: hypothetical protein LBB76_05485 [Azoarcus sp.]|nr:hypothetical protein [Azoarcus sp.]